MGDRRYGETEVRETGTGEQGNRRRAHGGARITGDLEDV
jgi:hypothetical protein